MASDRPAFAGSDRLGGTDAEVRSAFEGYHAYFGRFMVDAAAGTVTHHIEVIGARSANDSYLGIPKVDRSDV